MEAEPNANKRKFLSRKHWAKTVRDNIDQDESDEDELSDRGTKFSHIMDLHSTDPPPEVVEPVYDEDIVILSWYDSDLNLIIDEKNFTTASPLHDRGFCYLQAGARTTFGFSEGKVCFEVKLLNCCRLPYKDGHLNKHLLRVGWSPQKASLALGSDEKSYGYDSRGRASTIGEIMDYGIKFSTNDVIGAYLDLTGDTVTISYTVNGEDQGVVYDIPQSEIEKEPLFPHILTKNISYECHFGGKKSWFPIKKGYTFVGDVPLNKRIAGPKRPESKSDCEVVMMCGLPKSGKTSWVNEIREKNPGKYYVIDTPSLIDRMESKDPERKALLIRKTKVMGKLLAIAMDRRRNYILDQVNVVKSEQVWKLGLFKDFKRRIVVVVIPDDELQKRITKADDRPPDDLSWLYPLKAKFILPTNRCTHIAAVADKIEYVGLPEEEALQLVKKYNHEAWRLGFKPHKNFVIPGYVFKEKQKKVPGKWKERMLESANRNGNWNSPPSTRTKEGWQSPPREGSNEEWRQSPPRNRAVDEWHSPPRERMGSDWQMPRKRNNEEWHSPPGSRTGSGMRSPHRNRDEGHWQHQTVRRRDNWEPPPTNWSNERWGPEEERPVSGTQGPPRSRMENWQSQSARSPVHRSSPPRREPDGKYERWHSPTRNRPDTGRAMPDMRRNDSLFPESRSGGSVFPDDSVRRIQSDREERIDDAWITQDRRVHGELHSQERNMSSVRSHRDDKTGGSLQHFERTNEGMLSEEGRTSTRFPDQRQRMGEDFPHHEIALHRDFLPHQGRKGEFPPDNNRLSSGFSGQPDRTENSRPFQEGRLGSNLPLREERMGTIIHNRDERTSTNFAPQDRFRGRFPLQEGRIGSDSFHREGRVGGNFSSVGSRIDASFPPVESKMVDGLPFRGEIMGVNVQPQEARASGNFALLEGRSAGDLPSREGRIGGNMPLTRGRIDDHFSLYGRSTSGNVPPHRGRIGGDFPPLEGRIEGNLHPRDDRIIDAPPHGGRIGGDLHPGEHRVAGDLPLHESRANNFPLREGRRGDDLPVRGNRVGTDLTRMSRIADTLPPHDNKMGGGDMVPRGGRTDGNMSSHRGRIATDLPLHGGIVHQDLPPHRRRIDGLSPHEIKIGSNLQPQDERSGPEDQWHRLPLTGDRLPNYGPAQKQAWPIQREMKDKGDRLDSARGDVSDNIQSTVWPPERKGIPGNQWGNVLPPGNTVQGRGLQIQQLRSDGREHDTRFHDTSNRAGSDGWQTSRDRHMQADISPEVRARHNSRSPIGRNIQDQRSPVGPKAEHQSLLKRHEAQGRPLGVRQSPLGRGDRSPVCRSLSGGRSPVPGRSGGWLPPSAGHGDDWQPPENRNRGGRHSPERRGPGDRFPPHIRREQNSPPRKQSRLETRGLVGPSVLFPDGEDEGNIPHASHWKSPERGRKIDESSSSSNVNRDKVPSGNKLLMGPEIHGSSFDSRVSEPVRAAGQMSTFPAVGGMGEGSSEGIQSFPRGRVREEWQSPGDVGHWERVPQSSENRNTENEELAPYEQPFNQAVWDSNEPDAGIFQQNKGVGNSRRDHVLSLEDRSSLRSRREPGAQPQRPRGSVWQRVGGYVDDDDKGRNSRDPPGHNRFSSRHSLGSRIGRGHRMIGDDKERGRNFDENRDRRLRESSGDRRESYVRKQISPYSGERGYQKEIERNQWKSPAKKRDGR